MILSALLAASRVPVLQSALLATDSVGTPQNGSFSVEAPPEAVGRPGFWLFAHASRTNATTGQIRMGTVSIDGVGSLALVAGDGASNVDSPTGMWGLSVASVPAGPRNLLWDFAGAQYSVSTALAAWLIYGRPMTLAANGSRPAGGISVQSIRSGAELPADPGYTASDLAMSLSGNFVRMGRWFGPSAGSHPAGDCIITFSPT